MDCEALKTELQNRIDAFKNKWLPIYEEKYDGDAKKLYQENASALLEDVRPIWEICFAINCKEEIDKFIHIDNFDKGDKNKIIF